MLTALVIAHYDFKNDKGKEIKTTKLRVSLKDYGYLELCSDLANDYQFLEEVKVSLQYDISKNKYIIAKVEK